MTNNIKNLIGLGLFGIVLLTVPAALAESDRYQFSCTFTPFEIKTFAIAFNYSLLRG
jgi:hypothetical protein